MALGDNAFQGNRNNGRTYKAPETYSPVRFRNPNAEIEKSELSFSFWKGLLKISISLKMENEENKYDKQNAATVYLTPIKAKILHDEIDNMIFGENKGILRNVGVESGSTGLVSLSDGQEFGIDHYLLVIRNVAEDGKINSNYTYQFNGYDYYKSIRNFRENGGAAPTFDTKDFEAIEISTFLTILDQFYKSANAAIAASVVEATGYANYRRDENINAIMDQLGVSRSTSPRSKSNGSSFFNGSAQGGSGAPGNSGSSFHQASMDDLAGGLE